MVDDDNRFFNNFEIKEEIEENKELEFENYIFVVVLDFGIMYFGYVFSSRIDFVVNFLFIYIN